MLSSNWSHTKFKLGITWLIIQRNTGVFKQNIHLWLLLVLAGVQGDWTLRNGPLEPERPITGGIIFVDGSMAQYRGYLGGGLGYWSQGSLDKFWRRMEVHLGFISSRWGWFSWRWECFHDDCEECFQLDGTDFESAMRSTKKGFDLSVCWITFSSDFRQIRLALNSNPRFQTNLRLLIKSG